jgi:Conserved TM helix
MEKFLALVLEPLKVVFAKFSKFGPNLVVMLLIILTGIILARIIKFILIKLLQAINFDSWSDRMGLTSLLRKGNLWTKPSVAVGTIMFWLMIIAVLHAGLIALNIQAVDSLVAHFVLYLPRVLSAMLIIIIGYIVTAFISRAVLISAVNQGYHFAKYIAEAIRLLLIVLFVAMALEQLQVAPGIVVAAFSIIFGGIVLALAISFGIGGVEAAKKVLEKEIEKKDEEKHNIEHI